MVPWLALLGALVVISGCLGQRTRAFEEAQLPATETPDAAIPDLTFHVQGEFAVRVNVSLPSTGACEITRNFTVSSGTFQLYYLSWISLPRGWAARIVGPEETAAVHVLDLYDGRSTPRLGVNLSGSSTATVENVQELTVFAAAPSFVLLGPEPSLRITIRCTAEPRIAIYESASAELLDHSRGQGGVGASALSRHLVVGDRTQTKARPSSLLALLVTDATGVVKISSQGRTQEHSFLNENRQISSWMPGPFELEFSLSANRLVGGAFHFMPLSERSGVSRTNND